MPFGKLHRIAAILHEQDPVIAPENIKQRFSNAGIVVDDEDRLLHESGREDLTCGRNFMATTFPIRHTKECGRGGSRRSCYFERAMTRTLRRTLGANVRTLLDVRGMSQAGLAARIGKSQSTVSQIIHGRVPVAIDTIEALADALHVPHAALLSRTPVNSAKHRGS